MNVLDFSSAGSSVVVVVGKLYGASPNISLIVCVSVSVGILSSTAIDIILVNIFIVSANVVIDASPYVVSNISCSVVDNIMNDTSVDAYVGAVSSPPP